MIGAKNLTYLMLLTFCILLLAACGRGTEDGWDDRDNAPIPSGIIQTLNVRIHD